MIRKLEKRMKSINLHEKLNDKTKTVMKKMYKLT